ncbi:ABC transporter family substrate-binding protein [Streptomyces specialis]|uniref:ABC transporter family substrate-binding protein n=1 Tax=Streptomyces specialis TaxID=498367 RepID=UPI001F19210D|nr:ABC transporter family substrate-binding protein [Streptomyces specialis]
MRARPGRIRAARCAAALLAGVLLLPLLAGCTGQDEHDAAIAAAAQSVATARRAELKSGGSVTWGVDHLPATLNAFQTGADRVTDQVVGAILPALFTVDAHGRPQLNTDYLRSAEITEREPRQTVVYTLHPEARWSDGEPIAAADFIAQWKALNGEDDAFRPARNAGYDRIEKVTEGPGRHQVEVTFAQPYADWKSLFTPLYPRSVTGDADSFEKKARTGLPAAAGPFELKKLDPGKSTVTLVRNDAWWGDPALLDRLVFAAVPLDRRRAALVDGTLDVAEIRPADADRVTAAAEPGGVSEDGKGEPGRRPPATLDALHDLAAARLAGTGDEAAARERFARSFAESERARERAFAPREEAARERLRGFTVHRAYDATYTQLAMNGSSPALSDERVRSAVARALDRDALAAEVHEPAGLPARPLGNHLRVLGQAGYHDNSDALGETGADAARASLEEAGWRQTEPDTGADTGADAGADDGEAGAGAVAAPVRAKDGEPLELRLVLPSGTEGEQVRRGGRGGAGVLAGIGVAAEITKGDAAGYFTRHIAEGAFDLALFSWPATAYPATDARPLFAKPRPVPGGDALIQQNYTRVGTDHIDQLLEQAAGELDEKEHDRLLNKADARIWAAAGSIPLFQRPQLVAAPSTLAGVGAYGLATPRYQDIGYRR